MSAVLEKLGLPHILGYAPAVNAQFEALTAAIDRYLSTTDFVVALDATAPVMTGEDDPFVEPPPLSNRVSKTPKPILRLARKFDPVARDARNRVLGRKGEEFVLAQERRRLIVARA